MSKHYRISAENRSPVKFGYLPNFPENEAITFIDENDPQPGSIQTISGRETDISLEYSANNFTYMPTVTIEDTALSNNIHAMANEKEKSEVGSNNSNNSGNGVAEPVTKLNVLGNYTKFRYIKSMISFIKL